MAINGWMPTNFKAVIGLRDKEIVEVTNHPIEGAAPLDMYRGEHGLMPWSQWGYWRRYRPAIQRGSEVTEPYVTVTSEHPIGITGEFAAEAVDHPAHYNAHPSGIECIDVVRHMNFNLGNVVKYLWRAGEKDPAKHLEDLKKAAWYLNDEIERLSK